MTKWCALNLTAWGLISDITQSSYVGEMDVEAKN